MDVKSKLTEKQRDDLLKILEERFEGHMERHKGVSWADVLMKLQQNPDKIDSLHAMENTGGEPDVVSYDEEADVFVFMDCADETPEGRRNLCYDEEALTSRKKNKPRTSAEKLAAEMGVELLTEEEYRRLQTLGEFDRKTSSWIKTPDSIRKLGGAIFGDRRFDTVFIYHNGAESYYGVRGFRSSLKV
ncbi:MAG TPA: DUF4256 domain-containing protein [Proteiniclasticum sp.]|nr:DUF4256 domain-containing protein [Proteiniclasticum sp.]